jgi:hypothetical protein
LDCSISFAYASSLFLGVGKKPIDGSKPTEPARFFRVKNRTGKKVLKKLDSESEPF